jgi:NUMOD3 motif
MSWTPTPEQRAARERATARARELRDSGANWQAVANVLTAEGYQTMRGGPWYIKGVQRLLTAPLAEPSAGYIARHMRVRKDRGKASDQRCVDCGGQAYGWATIHGTDGMLPDDYQPMCMTCHMAYDGVTGSGRSEDTRARMSAAAGSRSAEHRANLSKSLKGRVGGMTGKRHSDETRRKMSDAQRARFAKPQTPQTP